MRNTLTASSRPRSRLARYGVALSARLNYERALRRPGRAPYVMLTEFPRSGGNWVRDMLGDALQLPVPRFSRLPVTFPSIVHNHDHRVLRGHPAIYVLRDGRDVFLSHLDKVATTYEEGTDAIRARVRKLHPSMAALAGEGARDWIDMSAFYGEWKDRPLGSRVNWGAHVGPWLEARPEGVTFVRYEDMRSDPESALAATLSSITDEPVPEATVVFAVSRNGFEAQTGRKPGDVDVTSTKRKGLAGAWTADMPQDLQDRFLKDFGRVLAAAGYDA